MYLKKIVSRRFINLLLQRSGDIAIHPIILPFLPQDRGVKLMNYKRIPYDDTNQPTFLNRKIDQWPGG